MGRKKGALNKKTLAKQSENSENGQLKLPSPSSNGTSDTHVKTDIPKIPKQPDAPKTDIDPDMFSDEIPSDIKDPLSEEVRVKSHTQIHIDPTKSGGSGDNKGGGNKPFEPTPDNKGGSGQQPKMSEAEVRTAADLSFKFFMTGYKKAHGLLRFWAKENKQTLMEREVKGEIDLQIKLPFKDDKTGENETTLSNFVDNFNASVDSDIVVDDSFEKDMKEPLTRVIIKRGWLVNDEMACIGLLIDDLATKGGVLYGMKKSMSMIVDLCLADALRKKKEREAGIKEAPKQTETPKQENTPPPNNPRTDNSVISDAVIEEETVNNTDDWRESGQA